jgi:hypothetical protein
MIPPGATWADVYYDAIPEGIAARLVGIPHLLVLQRVNI